MRESLIFPLKLERVGHGDGTEIGNMEGTLLHPQSNSLASPALNPAEQNECGLLKLNHDWCSSHYVSFATLAPPSPSKRMFYVKT